ncbi:glycosyltransferase, partial [Bradyrhizobium jicamae]|uniref:glycosyltransferase n=1 Tax=Bradyrhizobium jicamae TaxID=280332 RepID=UPI001FDA3E22
MRIAQVAPLAESIPPKLYGGTERVVAWLIEELVKLGHEVTLFASGDSKTRAELEPVWPRALRLGRPKSDPM